MTANEELRKIAEKFFPPEWHTWDNTGVREDTEEQSRKDCLAALQEARELIVRRCAEIAINNIGPEQIYQAILREFGLEGK